MAFTMQAGTFRAYTEKPSWEDEVPAEGFSIGEKVQVNELYKTRFVRQDWPSVTLPFLTVSKKSWTTDRRVEGIIRIGPVYSFKESPDEVIHHFWLEPYIGEIVNDSILA